VPTVNIAAVPAVAELGLIEHRGASAGEGCTEHERATEPLNPPAAVTFTVEVDDAPGLTVLGASGEMASEKSGDTDKLNVAVTDWLLFMATVHRPVPEQAPLHPENVDP
jgi:hypothetical protein